MWRKIITLSAPNWANACSSISSNASSLRSLDPSAARAKGSKA